MRRITCVPKYGAGLGLRAVAWISFRASVGASVEGWPSTHSLTGNIWPPTSLFNLVEQFLDRLADTLEPPRLRYGQIRICYVPGVGGDLVVCNPVPHGRAVHTRVAFRIAEQD